MKENEVEPKIEAIKVDGQPNSYTIGDDYRFKVKIKQNDSYLFLMVKLRYLGSWNSDDKIDLFGSISMRGNLDSRFVKTIGANLRYNTVDKKLILSDCNYEYSNHLAVSICQIKVY